MVRIEVTLVEGKTKEKGKEQEKRKRRDSAGASRLSLHNIAPWMSPSVRSCAA